MYQVRNVGLAVSMIADVQVEHELSESAMQPRQSPGQYHEPRSGDAPGCFEIHAHALAERDMILRRELELPRHTPAPNFDVCGLVSSIGDARVQEIGQSQLQ